MNKKLCKNYSRTVENLKGFHVLAIECEYSEYAEKNWENVIWQDFKDKLGLPDYMIYLGKTSKRVVKDSVILTFTMKVIL